MSVGAVPGRTGLFVTNVSQNWLLLSADALANFYARRTIYFWNTDHTGLIPDARYMPLSMPEEQQPTEVLNWLTSGPAGWLKQVAEPLPAGARSIGNVPAVSNGTMQVSLSAQVLPDDLTPAERQDALDRLQLQLRWSLQPNLQAKTLELNIEHQPAQTYKGNDYLSSNAAYRPEAQLQRFVVYEGQVRRLSRSYRSSEPVPALTAAANKDVRMVSYGQSRTRTYVALVVTEANGRQALRVGSATTGEAASLRAINLAKPIGRPVWAVSPPVGKADGTVGLIPAGGRLYAYAPDGTSVARVTWPGGPGSITSVAVAPDARRLALVAGGRLYLATMSNDDGVQLSAPVLIETVLGHLTAVDWVSESTLVVAGSNADSGRSAIMDVSIDGALQKNRLADLGSTPVSYLVASPASPSGGEDSAPVAYMLGTAAYDETRPDQIDVKDLAAPVANPRADAPPPNAPAFLD
jgi:Lipoprotein LpqB beta-propeller domain